MNNIEQIENKINRFITRFPQVRGFYTELGNTPLIEVPGPKGGAHILAKCEFKNPMGSVKDRAAFMMLASELADASEHQVSNMKILAYSGGSLALSLAFLCQKLGLQIKLVLSEITPSALLTQLADLGAEVELVAKEKGFLGTIERSLELSHKYPNLKFIYQHTSDGNIYGHEATTGKEILTQSKNLNVAAWVASIGTGGTLIGVANALKSRFHTLQVYAVTPSELPYGSQESPNSKPKFAGSGGLGYGQKQLFVQRQEDLVTGHYYYPHGETLTTMLKFYKETNIKIGTSAAANFLAATDVAKRFAPNTAVITVFPSAGTKEEWEKLCQSN